MKGKELQRKLKIERIEVCVNCILFTDCNTIGRLIECEGFVEVEREKAMVIIRLEEYSQLKSSRK
jgi:hypothetical protein